MNKQYILDKIRKLKPKYEKEGVILLGLFGSYAKDTADENSDIDLLYKLDADKFLENHKGFTGFTRLLTIQEELKNTFHKNIDLCTINGNNKTFNKYALADAIYV